MNKKLLVAIVVLVGLIVWVTYDIFTGTISEDHSGDPSYEIPTIP